MDHLEPNDELARAIVRVLSGDLTEREEIELREWLLADPERRRVFNEMRAVWDEAAVAPTSAGGESGGAWDTSALQKRIIDASRLARRRHSPTFTRMASSSTRVLPIAAAITLLVGGGVATWYATRPGAAKTVAVASLKEVTTKRGQRASLQLPDGSRITLGPASTVRYGAREAELAGEAYFEVVHDSTRPFVVKTALGVARDLGTKFFVREEGGGRREEEGPAATHVDVIVVEGIVSLGPAGDSVVLKARDLGRLDAAGNVGVEHNTDIAPVLAWTRGQLVFRNAAVPAVIGDLERSYDVSIRVADPLLRELRFSGSFGAAPAADVVASFARAIGASVEKDNEVFVLRRGGGTR